MSQVQSPNGLRPVKTGGDSHNAGTVNHYPLTTDNSAVIAIGDLVALVSGSIAPVAANPAAGTLSANSPVGVFLGVKYDDGNQERFRAVAPIDVHTAAVGSVDVTVYDDLNAVFSVQANGTLAASVIGQNIGLGGFASSDVANKTSRLYADTATLSKSSSSTAPFKIIGFDTTSGNAPGDAFTQILVRYNANVHAFTLAGSQ
jgi:hypothetical protein